jgi:hypothetical protein
LLLPVLGIPAGLPFVGVIVLFFFDGDNDDEDDDNDESRRDAVLDFSFSLPPPSFRFLGLDLTDFLPLPDGVRGDDDLSTILD